MKRATHGRANSTKDNPFNQAPREGNKLSLSSGRAFVFGAAIALVANAMFLSGCTAIGALAGGLLGACGDTLAVTSPFWGPGTGEKNCLENQAGKIAIATAPTAEDAPAKVCTFTRDTTPPITLRLFTVPPVESSDEDSYFSWWGALPLVPYYTTEVPVRQAHEQAFPFSFTGVPTQESQRVKFPLERLPEGLRPKSSVDIAGPVREALLSALKWEIVSQTPSRADCASALWDARAGAFSLRSTLLARRIFAEELGESRIAIELPGLDGQHQFRTGSASSNLENALNASLEDALCSGGSCSRISEYSGSGLGMKVRQRSLGGGNAQEDDARDILFSMENGACTALVPGRHILVRATTRHYSTPSPGQIVVTAKVRSIIIQRTRLTYGITLPLSNLISLFGVPNSRNRLAMELELQARQGPEGKEVLSRTYEIKTAKRFVGVYYGGKMGAQFSEEMAVAFGERLREFAKELKTVSPADSARIVADASNQ